MKRLRKTGMSAALVGAAVAGTMVLSAGNAAAGAWFDTGWHFSSKGACDAYAGSVAANYGWGTWDCRDDNSGPSGFPWHLFAYES